MSRSGWGQRATRLPRVVAEKVQRHRYCALLVLLALLLVAAKNNEPGLRALIFGPPELPHGVSGPYPAPARPPLLTTSSLDESYARYGYVAHALGSVDGRNGTNSLEAFRHAYAQGFRLFEADLIELADGRLMVAHDGTSYALFGIDKPYAQITWDELRGRRIRGTYTAMTAERLVDLMAEHPDAYLITDIKSDFTSGLGKLVHLARRQAPAVLPRIIPQIYKPRELPQALKLYRFADIIFTLYRSQLKDGEVVRFVRNTPVTSVTANWRSRYSHRLMGQLRQLGVPVFVHTVNAPFHIRYFAAQRVGVYTDFAIPGPPPPMPAP